MVIHSALYNDVVEPYELGGFIGADLVVSMAEALDQSVAMATQRCIENLPTKGNREGNQSIAERNFKQTQQKVNILLRAYTCTASTFTMVRMAIGDRPVTTDDSGKAPEWGGESHNCCTALS